YSAEYTDAARARRDLTHPIDFKFLESSVSVFFYTFTSLALSYANNLAGSKFDYLLSNLETFFICALIMGGVAYITAKPNLHGFAARAVASFTRSTGVFILCLSCFYLVSLITK
ncbi:hypothetical protein, partial [Methylobacterium sp. WL12]|uniref:hypothetical protein n=1 Tax=Methylobacterium sp. WL12 TaxID=2603890 RepID=UPI001AEF01A8